MSKFALGGIIGFLAYSAKASYYESYEQPVCPPNSSYVAYYDACVCWNGFKQEGDYCVPLCKDPNTHFDQEKE